MRLFASSPFSLSDSLSRRHEDANWRASAQRQTQLRNKNIPIMTNSFPRPVSGTSRNTSGNRTRAGQAEPESGPSYVAGADIGGTNLRLALADSQGNIAARWSASTIGIRNAEPIVELIRAGVQAMLDEISAPAESLKAIAAGAPGATNVGDGIVV